LRGAPGNKSRLMPFVSRLTWPETPANSRQALVPTSAFGGKADTTIGVVLIEVGIQALTGVASARTGERLAPNGVAIAVVVFEAVGGNDGRRL
jgi:hypothetical protein